MSFPFPNSRTDPVEFEQFCREDRRAYLVSVAVVIVIMACGFVVSVYAATHFFN
jgi:hypothetical protein